MSGIICAIRGGPGSQPTIEKAISLALEINLPLYFLYVVNLDFLAHTQSSKTSTITEQLIQMGEFILFTAQEKAGSQGVEAHAIIHHGKVMEKIITTALETNADYIVLGMPGDDHEQNEFVLDRIKEYGNKIQQQSGAEVILVGGAPEE
jgi:nucleotide-binding universal stress UspA family protein